MIASADKPSVELRARSEVMTVGDRTQFTQAKRISNIVYGSLKVAKHSRAGKIASSVLSPRPSVYLRPQAIFLIRCVTDCSSAANYRRVGWGPVTVA